MIPSVHSLFHPSDRPFILHLWVCKPPLEYYRSCSASLSKQKKFIGVPWHTGICGTLSLTETTVTTEAAGLVQLTGAAARVHGDGLADNEAIRDELADRLARVGIADLAGLVGVEPDLALTAADDCGGQALLSTEVDPVDGVLSAI